jgi:hypothetical protein
MLEDKNFKRHFHPAAPASAGGRCRPQRWRRPQHAATACHSGAPHGGARPGAGWTGSAGGGRLRTAGCSGGEGLGTARREKLGGRAGGTIANGISPCQGATYTAAARTALLGPRWRGLRRTRIARGDNGPGPWAAGRRPAGDDARGACSPTPGGGRQCSAVRHGGTRDTGP